MKTFKWFFTTNEDGENPAVMLLSSVVGLMLAFLMIWIIAGCPKLPITTAP